ncbi:acetyl-CoA hydrolase/transferase family protein [Psychrilyobacter sp.]|uniref:acetyl-CoA hydrolase/transferase family protein n=1 Tax=Psychrilyobacter sp. TaxID=2586924 RepID=UPI0030188DDE
MQSRIRNEKLKEKIMSPMEACKIIKNGMVVGTSGFTPSGYPKVVPLALAERVKESKEIMKLTLYSGASLGPEVDGAWAEAGIIAKRLPYQTNKKLRQEINCGKVEYLDMHLSHSSQYLNYGALPRVDVAIIEAIAITEDGNIIPTSAVGNSPSFLKSAKKIIVEISSKQPIELEGMSDIYMLENPPRRTHIPIEAPGDRIGTPYIVCDKDKIAAIVFSDLEDHVRDLAPICDTDRAISKNIIGFLEKEVALGRLTNSLLPLQSGVGNVANAVLAGLCDSNFENLVCYTEVLQDAMLELMLCGKIIKASACSISPSPKGLKLFRDNIEFFKDKIILRPLEISNSPEMARKLGVIAMNTAIEADIYGNINSTHIMGTKIMNGIGGSGDFARNAYLTIFSTSSTAKNGKISSIVPMVSHVDHTEHDTMILVTEQGVADLRGLSPKEKARVVIENCVHPDFKEQMKDYFDRACEVCHNCHTPHILEEALSWHSNFLETGTMKK